MAAESRGGKTGSVRKTEYKWWAKLYHKILGIWPKKVVEEQIADFYNSQIHNNHQVTHKRFHE